MPLISWADTENREDPSLWPKQGQLAVQLSFLSSLALKTFCDRNLTPGFTSLTVLSFSYHL